MTQETANPVNEAVGSIPSSSLSLSHVFPNHWRCRNDLGFPGIIFSLSYSLLLVIIYMSLLYAVEPKEKEISSYLSLFPHRFMPSPVIPRCVSE